MIRLGTSFEVNLMGSGARQFGGGLLLIACVEGLNLSAGGASLSKAVEGICLAISRVGPRARHFEGDQWCLLEKLKGVAC